MASTSAAAKPPPTLDLDVALNAARTAAQAAGDYLRSASSAGRRAVTLKHGVEVVTDADLRADTIITQALAAQFPAHKIVSEETNTATSPRDVEGPAWIVDPLDGSVNFAHGHLSVAVSIAFALDGKVLAGIVLAPFLNQTFTAIQGQGAFRDGVPVQPVRPNTVARSLAIGNPADGDFAVATARRTGGAIYTVAEEAVGENMALLAATTGVFGETATGVTLGALRAAIAAGELGPTSRVVLLVTGDGLKTPAPVAHTYNPVLIEADADAFIDQIIAA